MDRSKYTGYKPQYGDNTQQQFYPGHYGDQPAGHYHGQNNGQYGNPPGYSGSYAQSQPQYQSTPPVLRNPFAAPAATPMTAGYPGGANEQYELDESQQMAQWHAAYGPVDQYERGNSKRGGRNDRGEAGNANLVPVGPRPAGDAIAAAAAPTTNNGAGVLPGLTGEVTASSADGTRQTVMRKGGGQTWEDKTLLEWDPTQFRIMVGNLAGEVTDESLAKAFAAYGVSKARVVRDKVTTKSRGFGFVSFFEGEQGFRAAREMVGKYIGSHPVTIQRSKTDLRPVTKKRDDHRHHGKNKNRNQQQNKARENRQDDPLKANTGAGIEKKSNKAPAGLKVLG